MKKYHIYELIRHIYIYCRAQIKKISFRSPCRGILFAGGGSPMSTCGNFTIYVSLLLNFQVVTIKGLMIFQRWEYGILNLHVSIYVQTYTYYTFVLQS